MRCLSIFLLLLLGTATTPITALAAPQEARKANLKDEPPDSPTRMEIVRVQILLDRAGFRPGKLDGLGGEFTQKSAERYAQAKGLTLPLDLSSVPTPYREYTVTEEDTAWIGPQAREPSAQEKLKAMLYASLWELVAEKFHCDLDFLRELNPQIPEDKLTVGTTLRVPDVEEFRLPDVKALELKRREEAKAREASPMPPDPTAPQYNLVLLRRERLIEVYDGDMIVACFPCTPGSAKTPVPLGNWRIIGNILLPYFRWDKSVLESGVRSDTAYNLPPGPNNPVGIVWMGLNRPSVGMHGTPNPDQIGRNESHGCIRLANWDAFTLSQLVRKGTGVEVRD